MTNTLQYASLTRSSKVVDFGSRRSTCSFLWINSNLGPVVSRFRNITGFLLKQLPQKYSTKNLGMFPWTTWPTLGQYWSEVAQRSRASWPWDHYATASISASPSVICRPSQLNVTTERRSYVVHLPVFRCICNSCIVEYHLLITIVIADQVCFRGRCQAPKIGRKIVVKLYRKLHTTIKKKNMWNVEGNKKIIKGQLFVTKKRLSYKTLHKVRR